MGADKRGQRRNKWTNEGIVEEVRRLYEAGEDLSARSMQRKHSALFSSARSRSHFGSWRAAIEAADLDYESIKRPLGFWSKQQITDQIRQRHQQGKSLSPAVVRQEDPRLYAAACSQRYFGGWAQAVEVAGLDYSSVKRRRRWNPHSILETIRQLHEQGVDLRWSNVDRLNPSLYRAARRPQNFGSWRGALKAAGIAYEELAQPTQWSRQRIVEEIQRLQEAGEDLSPSQIARRHPRLVAVARDKRYFGSWEMAVRAAGIDYDQVRRTQRWSKQRILDEIRRLHEAGEDLRQQNMRAQHLRLLGAARDRRYFGSWEAAVRAAGIDYARIRHSRRARSKRKTVAGKQRVPARSS